jgi:hypothetical protein
VRWRLEGDTFMMSWNERDGPPVSTPKRRGFGSTVVDSMAKLSVGGEVQLDYAPQGLNWRLMCPATNAVERLGNESNLTRAASARNGAAPKRARFPNQAARRGCQDRRT